jgi:hypothetical protein
LAGVVFVRHGTGRRVAVFIDWQNVYMGARHAFHQQRAPRRLGNVDPARLARRLLELSPGADRELVDLRVYRGQPDPSRDPRGYAANRRQQLAWQQAGVTVVQRPLRSPKAWPAEKPQEKGVDVAGQVVVSLSAGRGLP